VKGHCRDVIVPSLYLPGGTEENHEDENLRYFGTKTWIRHLASTSKRNANDGAGASGTPFDVDTNRHQGTEAPARTSNAALKAVKFAWSATFRTEEQAAQWLRHYATGLKVADSRPDEVNDFFQST
jgi:hypothetical protein